MDMDSVKEREFYFVTLSVIGCVHTQNGHCICSMFVALLSNFWLIYFTPAFTNHM